MAIKTGEHLSDNGTVEFTGIQEKIAASLGAAAFKDPSGRIYRLHGYDSSLAQEQGVILEAAPGIFTDSKSEFYEASVPASSRPVQYSRISIMLHGVYRASCMSVEVSKIIE